MNIREVKNIILAALAAIGGILTEMTGGWDTTMQVLIVFMSADFLCGLILAGVFKKSKKSETGRLESDAGIKGIFKKVGILISIIIGVHLDMLLGYEVAIRNALIFYFVAIEGISIAENLALMGVPMPKFIIDMLEQMQGEASMFKKDKEQD